MTTIARNEYESHPMNRPTTGFVRRDAHWYENPDKGILAASAPKTSATHSWPTMTTGQVQIDAGPPLCSANAMVVKMPVVIEMNENATANDVNERIVRSNSCR